METKHKRIDVDTSGATSRMVSFLMWVAIGLIFIIAIICSR